MAQPHTQASKASLFSRAQEVSTPSKKIRGFLGLPGEIRNRVYHYYFQKDFRCEIASIAAKFLPPELKIITLCVSIVDEDSSIYKYRGKPRLNTPATVRITRRLGHYSLVKGSQTNWSSSLCALVLVCKQVHSETLVFLYHNTTFVFDAPQRILNFIRVLPKKNLSHVTKLHIHYATYGDPGLAEHLVWQTKHLDIWTRACKAASKGLVNLRELEVWLQVNTSPLRFDLHATWLEPLLRFRRLSCPRRVKDEAEQAGDAGKSSVILHEAIERQSPLKVVKVHLKTYWSGHHALAYHGQPALAHASFDLHHLFAQAVGLAILGKTEPEAMADFKEAWEGKYQKWQHHLNFSYTGW